MKKKILFVDDEPMILQGLQRMLRSMRDEWEMVFVDGGERALEAMAGNPFDVVVTDMRMPVMNGAQLLMEVRRRHPMTVRLILSGHADNDLVAQCLGVAHQYISKPCDPEQLKTMIQNACLIGDDRVTGSVKALLGSIDRLPCMPEVFKELEQALADPDANARRVGEIIQQDMGMTAKLLKIVNSAFFGLRRTISSPFEAVTYLGIDTVKALVLVNSIFERAEPIHTRHLGLDDLWHHSLATANAAKAIALTQGSSRQQAEDIFVGGVLEDVGILVLAGNFPEAYDRAAEVLLAEHLLLTTVEQEEFAVTHAEVGAYLLGLWGIPAPVLQIVSLHHSPQRIKEPGFSPALAVYAADILVGEQGGNPLFRTGRFDPATLHRLGLADRIEAWRQAIHELPGEHGGTHNG
jgi:HD-like signal output (HDOD) protein